MAATSETGFESQHHRIFAFGRHPKLPLTEATHVPRQRALTPVEEYLATLRPSVIAAFERYETSTRELKKPDILTVINFARYQARFDSTGLDTFAPKDIIRGTEEVQAASTLRREDFLRLGQAVGKRERVEPGIADLLRGQLLAGEAPSADRLSDKFIPACIGALTIHGATYYLLNRLDAAQPPLQPS